MRKSRNRSKHIGGKLPITHQVKAQEYTAPNIEIVEIEIEQNIFAGSGDLPGMQGEPW